MTSLPLGHIAGLPIEETLASFTPALVLAFGAASATLRAHLRRALSHRPLPHPQSRNAQQVRKRAHDHCSPLP